MTVLAVLLVLSAVLAWWGARRTRDTADFYAAGHRAGATLVGLAGTAAALSAFTFVGGPGSFAALGAGSLWIIASAPLTGALQCWAVGERVVGLVARHRAVTLPQLLGARFGGRVVPAVAALVVAAGCIASLAVQARAAAVLGQNFLGVDGRVAAGALLLATTAYVASGGMRAGLLADAVQGSAMALVAVLLAAGALWAAGGPLAALATLERARPELLGAFGKTPPAAAFALFLLFAVGTCAQPHYVQKFFFLRASDQLKRLPVVLTVALAVTLTVWVGVGLGGTALVADGRIVLDRPDDLAPRTMALLGPWAVLLAGIGTTAALMSTAASFLNLAAAALAVDLPRVWGREPRGLAGSRVATVLVAVVATLVGVSSDKAVVLLGIIGWGFFTAALLPVMTAGLAWRGATARGVAAAMIAGAVVDVALELQRASLPAGLEPGLAGTAAGMIVLVAVSMKPIAFTRRG